MNRKSRFWFGLFLLTSLFFLPIVIAATARALLILGLFALGYFVCLWQLYRMTLRNIKLKYPAINPEGQADVYTGRMPRPIYEDMKRYPWFFGKKREKHSTKKVKRRKR